MTHGETTSAMLRGAVVGCRGESGLRRWRGGSVGAETPLGSMQRQTCGRTPTAVVEWGVGCVRVGFETWGVAFAVGRGAAAAGAVGAHITESISSTESLLPECSEDGAARRGTVLIAGVAGWRTVSCGSGP